MVQLFVCLFVFTLNKRGAADDTIASVLRKKEDLGEVAKLVAGRSRVSPGLTEPRGPNQHDEALCPRRPVGAVDELGLLKGRGTFFSFALSLRPWPAGPR